jgi:hypothetical protein
MMLYTSSGLPFSIGVPVNANLIGMLADNFLTALDLFDLNPLMAVASSQTIAPHS